MVQCSFAQTYHLKQELKEQFAESNGELWFTSYLGFEKSKFPVDFVIGQDGETYRAILQYPMSDKKLYYDGDYSDEDNFSLAEYDESGTLTGHLKLSKKPDHISAEWYVTDVESTVSILLIPDKIGRIKNPVVPMAANYKGNFMGNVVDCKAYYQKNGLLLILTSNDQQVELLLEYKDDLFSTYEMVNTQLFDHTYDKVIFQITENKLSTQLVRSGKSTLMELSLTEILPAKTIYIAGYKSHLDVSLPVQLGKKFQKWTSSILALTDKDKQRIQNENIEDDFSFEERYKEWVGVDTKISYFDTNYMSGDVFIYTSDGLAMESFVYDRLKDKFLDITDVISSKAIKTLNNSKTEMYSQVQISADGFLFHGEYDVNFGLQKSKLSFADIATSDQDIIANKALRKHFLNK